MDNNELLMIVLAFVVGYMASGMLKNMCGGGLVEGTWIPDDDWETSWSSIGKEIPRDFLEMPLNHWPDY